MRGLTNTSYIFIPFSFYKQADFDSLIEAFGKNNAWEQIHDELTYMLKYVSDKIDSRNKEACQCFHYRLRDSARDRFDLATENDWFSTATHLYRGQDEIILCSVFGRVLILSWEKALD